MRWLCGDVLLVAFMFASPGMSLLAKRLTRAYAFFVLVGVIGRSLYLLHYKPAPLLDEPLADANLATPAYRDTLPALWRISVIGLAVFIVAVIAIDRAIVRRTRDSAGMTERLQGRMAFPVRSAGVVYLVGYGFRILSLGNHGSLGSLGSQLGSLCSVGLGALLLLNEWRTLPQAKRLVAMAIVGEVAYSLAIASKTPLLGAALFFFLDPKRGRINVRLLAAGALALLVAFGVVQGLKPHQQSALNSTTNAGVVQKSEVKILDRFDYLDALSVAAARGPATPYISRDDFFLRAAEDVLPQQVLGSSKTLSGLLWGQAVRHTTSGASFAPNLSPEGYVEDGWLGVIIWNLGGALLLAITSRLVVAGRSTFAVAQGLSILGSTALFERGLVGSLEIVGVSLRAAVVATLLVKLVARRGDPPLESGAAIPSQRSEDRRVAA